MKCPYKKWSPEWEAWKADRKKIVIEKQKEFIKNHPIETWASRTIYRHRKQGYTVSVDAEFLKQKLLETPTCFYCGDSIGYKSGDKLPSLDRRNNKLWIDRDNIDIICRECNVFKRKRPQKSFIDYCHKISDHIGTK